MQPVDWPDGTTISTSESYSSQRELQPRYLHQSPDPRITYYLRHHRYCTRNVQTLTKLY